MKKNAAPETFGTRLARLRAARKMTQAGLARAVGVHRSAVLRWESGARGSHMPIATMRLLAAAVGVDVGTLIGAG